jgi:hypothetical protein
MTVGDLLWILFVSLVVIKLLNWCLSRNEKVLATQPTPARTETDPRYQKFTIIIHGSLAVPVDRIIMKEVTDAYLKVVSGALEDGNVTIKDPRVEDLECSLDIRMRANALGEG